MTTYHRFVFNESERRFVGDFEAMYQAETVEKFDSWHQDDEHRLDLNMTSALVRSVEPETVLDIGSGKGLLVAMISSSGRRIIGSDVSQTALETARERNPSASFVHIPDSSLGSLQHLLRLSKEQLGVIDLVLCSQVLSYIENWELLVREIFEHSKSICISLYVPENPIGYVKSWDDVCTAVQAHSNIKSSLWDSAGRTGYLLATR